MSTATLLRTADRLLLTVNRDAFVDAPPELPPSLQLSELFSAAMLHPRETGRGGSWVCGSSLGMVGCILPGFSFRDEQRVAAGGRFRSRGSLLVSLFAYRSAGEAVRCLLDQSDHEQYGSYILLLANLQGTWLVEWDGVGAEPKVSQPHGDWIMATTSRWRTSEVRAWRRQHFRRWLEKGAPMVETVPEFNLHQPPDALEWAPLLRRRDEATRSITQLEVQGARTLEARYWSYPKPVPGLPDSTVDLALDARAPVP